MSDEPTGVDGLNIRFPHKLNRDGEEIASAQESWMADNDVTLVHVAASTSFMDDEGNFTNVDLMPEPGAATSEVVCDDCGARRYVTVEGDPDIVVLECLACGGHRVRVS